MKGLVGFSWVYLWMPTERDLANGAIQGILVAIAFAFIILFIATYNIIITIISIICVAIVVLSLVAIMQYNNQKLGLSESISMVVMIGFSVDYIVHLA